MNVHATAVPAHRYTWRLNLIRISRWFWASVAMSIMFLMSYSMGIHEENPLHILHYPVVALSIAAFFLLGSAGRRLRLRFSVGLPIAMVGWKFLTIIILSAIVGGQGYFSAVHIVIWHVAVLLFWLLYFANVGKPPFDGVNVSWIGVVILAVAALGVGIYMQYVGEINLPFIKFEHPMFRGAEYQRLMAWFSSPNRTGSFLMYGLMGCVFVWPWNKGGLQKILLIVGGLGLGIGILLAGSRSAIVATFIFLLVTAFPYVLGAFFRFRRLFFAAMVVITITVVFSVTELGQEFLVAARLDRPFLSAQTGGVALDNREIVWDKAYGVFMSASPFRQFFGSGPGSIITSTDSSSHSGWISVFVEQGLLGGILMLVFTGALIAGSFVQYMRRRTSPDLRHFFLCQAAFWLAYAALNVSLPLFTVPRLDSLIMMMVFAQHGFVRSGRRRSGNMVH